MFSGKSLLSLVVVTFIALVAPLLGTTSASAAPERRVYEKKVTLTSSISGYPVSGAPADQRLKRADVVLRYYDDGDVAIDADVWVKAPAGWGDSQIYVGIGRFVHGSECQVDNGRGHYAISRITDDDDESKYWAWNSSMPNDTSFNCAVVLVQEYSGNPSSAQVFDAMIGSLSNTYVQPKLALSRPQLLGKNQKQLKLVRKAKQNHSFVVKNTGKYRARNVVIVAKGKGIKSVRKKVGTIAPGQSATVKVPLTLKSKAKKTKVKFTVSGSGVKASRTVKVKAVKAPAKPSVGKWRSKDKSFTFTVKNGKVTKFRGIRLRMSCGGGLNGYTTYRTVNLAFPTVKVPKHGYVEASKKWRQGNSWYSASLSGRVVGKKMTQAKFTYFTAGNCSVVDRFTARRR